MFALGFTAAGPTGPAESVGSTPGAPASPPLHHPHFAHLTRAAICDFAALPAHVRSAIRSNLAQVLVPLGTWLDQVSTAGESLLCLGEDHDSSLRELMATQIFSRLPLDVLMLEAMSWQLETVEQTRVDAPERALLRGARIATVLAAARARNPSMTLRAIDESPAQQLIRQRRDPRLSRDASMIANVQSALRPGARHVLLLAAMHCRADRNWFYDMLRNSDRTPRPASLRNARVVAPETSGAAESLVRFLDGIGLGSASFAIDDLSALHPRLKGWFALLGHAAAGYRSLLVLTTTGRDSQS